MITLYTRKQRGKNPDMYRSLINGILDDPDFAPTAGVLCVFSGVGEGEGEGEGEGSVSPVPLLQRSPSQQDLHTYSSVSGSGPKQRRFEQKSLAAHFRVKRDTVPLPRIFLEMTHLVSSELQVTFSLLPSAQEFNEQYWRASVYSSRLQL